MKLLIEAILFTAASCATLPIRQDADGCCFQLASVGRINETVLEDHVGDLLLGGTFQQGGFCFDKTKKTIQDALRHNCFMRAPNYQFECYQGAIGATGFAITGPREDGNSYLTYDDGPGVFFACPVASGNNEQSYDIYSDKTNKTGCLSVSLALVGETAACSASRSTVPTNSTTVQSTQLLKRQASSPTCSVSPSAPSLAPYRVRPGNSSAHGIFHDESVETIIAPGNSTIFDYTIPEDFIPADAASESSLCALQFRMPVCTSLPVGYPCYGFSGLEQEVLANSGMTFRLMSEDGGISAAWNSTQVHQVFPGDATIIGTFECGSLAGSYSGGARKMSWEVSSVRNFALEFLQAGVGRDADFKDGVGAWIVPCQ